MLAPLHLVHAYVQGPANDLGVMGQLFLRAQVQDEHVLARFLFVVQFVHGDARGLQLVEEPAALIIFATDIECGQTDHDGQRAATKPGQCADDLLQLLAEGHAQKHEEPGVEQ